MSKAKVAKLVKQIDASKMKIAQERNKLRDIYRDLEDLLETLDHGI